MDGVDSDKIRIAAVSAIEHLSREIQARRILSQHEGIMLAMTRASYLSGKTGSNRSLVTEDDDSSVTTTTTVNKRIQMALKQLVGAM